MARSVKAPAVRRAELLDAANQLFQTKGYAVTTVDDIVQAVGVAKGTFYYYFKSKEAILTALVDQLMQKMVIGSQQIADKPDLNAIEKIVEIAKLQGKMMEKEEFVVIQMYLPENQKLNDKVNVEVVLLFSPIWAAVVEQGNREGVFQVEDPLSTCQFILAASQFMTGNHNFHWTEEQQAAHSRAMMIFVERAFGAKPNTLIDVMLNTYLPEQNGQKKMGALMDMMPKLKKTGDS